MTILRGGMHSNECCLVDWSIVINKWLWVWRQCYVVYRAMVDVNLLLLLLLMFIQWAVYRWLRLYIPLSISTRSHDKSNHICAIDSNLPPASPPLQYTATRTSYDVLVDGHGLEWDDMEATKSSSRVSSRVSSISTFYSMKWLRVRIRVRVRIRSTFHGVDIPANTVLQISR